MKGRRARERKEYGGRGRRITQVMSELWSLQLPLTCHSDHVFVMKGNPRNANRTILLGKRDDSSIAKRSRFASFFVVIPMKRLVYIVGFHSLCQHAIYSRLSVLMRNLGICSSYFYAVCSVNEHAARVRDFGYWAC